ncbi:hypothetical protein DFH29DRAFT_386306 [Suillus ampliporus]|nr:hypothetical protein DFH29DRAFT_386306 [Suillus ampliporus]
MTPHASPSYCPPAKRPRLSKSTNRVLDVWAQLAERYNKRLDEDDIVDLYTGVIISDRGVLKNEKDCIFGYLDRGDSQDDQDQDQEQEQEHGTQEQDDDLDELDTLHVRRVSGTDGTMASTSELLRAVPPLSPLSATTDADDLNDFLEAEKRRRELLGDEDGEDDMSMEELAALREVLGESEEDEEQPETVEPEDAALTDEESDDEPEDAAITDEESDDELSVWQHDEASVVYPITRNESEQDVAEGEQKILEFTDSDEEFAALLERPPRVGKRKRAPSPSPSQRTCSPSPSHRNFSPSPSRRNSSPSLLSSPIPKRKFPSSPSQRGTSSESTLVPDTPSTTASTRFASRTPRTEVNHFATPSVDPTQPPQYLLYQAMQQLSYALSATMLTYGSPHMPPPPIAPWGAHPPGFAHPWEPQGTSVTPLSFKLDDDERDDDKPDDESTLVDHNSGVAGDDRRRRRPTSPVGSGKDARKIERRKGIQSGRSYEEKNQGQRTMAKGRTPGTPSPVRGSKGSASANKKKGSAKRKS